MADNGDAWESKITIREAYLAMQDFIFQYWKDGGETENDVHFLIGQIMGDPPKGIDPQHERGWLDAITRVTG